MAHHAFSAEFDVNKPLTLKGTLSKWEMINPHSWFHIDVKGPDGQVTEWMIEGGSPNTLIRLGVTKYTVKIGTELTIEGYQAKEATNKAVGRNFVLPDGTRLFLSLSSAVPGGAPCGNEVRQVEAAETCGDSPRSGARARGPAPAFAASIGHVRSAARSARRRLPVGPGRGPLERHLHARHVTIVAVVDLRRHAPDRRVDEAQHAHQQAGSSSK